MQGCIGYPRARSMGVRGARGQQGGIQTCARGKADVLARMQQRWAMGDELVAEGAATILLVLALLVASVFVALAHLNALNGQETLRESGV